jgi:hypothetical protein
MHGKTRWKYSKSLTN